MAWCHSLTCPKLYIYMRYKAKNRPGWVFPALNSAVPRTFHCTEVLAITILNYLMTPWESMASKNLLLFVLFIAQTLVQDSYLSSTTAIIVWSHTFFRPWVILKNAELYLWSQRLESMHSTLPSQSQYNFVLQRSTVSVEGLSQRFVHTNRSLYTQRSSPPPLIVSVTLHLSTLQMLTSQTPSVQGSLRWHLLSKVGKQRNRSIKISFKDRFRNEKVGIAKGDVQGQSCLWFNGSLSGSSQVSAYHKSTFHIQFSRLKIPVYAVFLWAISPGC